MTTTYLSYETTGLIILIFTLIIGSVCLCVAQYLKWSQKKECKK